MDKNFNYTLGLDLGISSVGWAVIEIESTKNSYKPKRLISSGVRLFDRAIDQGQDPPAKIRRESRSVRRTLRRRKYRLNYLKKYLLKKGFTNSIEELQEISDPWQIRYNSLYNRISNKELSQALFHITKRRGFKSNRKVAKLEDEEGGKFAEYIKENAEILEKYKTVGEMFYLDRRFKSQKRNRRGNYKQMVSRKMLEEEIKLILNKQKEFGNKKITAEFIDDILEIFNYQLPFASEDSIIKLVGSCSLLPEEKRAPKDSITFSIFRAIQQIKNNIKLINKNTGEIITLNEDQIRKIIEKLFEFKSDIKLTHIRKWLELKDELEFKGIENQNEEKKTKSGITSFKGFHNLRKAIEPELPDFWENIKDDYITLDKLVYCLTVFKSDEDIEKYLKDELNIDPNKINKLLKVLPSFSGFGHISIKAASELIPHLYKDKVDYTKACEMAGFNLINVKEAENKKLPPFDFSNVTNPHVKKSASQARKVINAVIDKYGSPTFINIEFARDLKNPENIRTQIEKENKENNAKNEKIIKILKEDFKIEYPSGTDITKYKLWKEQNGKCLISQKGIEPNKLFKDNYTQVDHAIPYSRSFDDGYKNKILILSSVNQKKSNKTPFEFFGSDSKSKDWHKFREYVYSLKTIPIFKKRFITKTAVPEEEEEVLRSFKDRDLNDTRYISRLLKELIENKLKFKGFDKKRRVYVVQGKLTNMLRKRYGFNKDRDVNVRHHALDAVLVGVTNQWMVQKVAEWSSAIEKSSKRIYFPEPWEKFRQDVFTRIMEDQDKIKKLLKTAHFKEMYGDIHNQINELFVSRAPRRKVNGQAHKETIYKKKGKNKKGLNIIQVNKPLEGMKIPIDKFEKKIDESHFSDPAYKKALLEAVKNSDGKTEKAFKNLNSGENEILKGENGSKIYSILEKDSSNDLVELKRGNGKGYALNSRIVRTDVFTNDGKYFLIPIYLPEVLKGELPNRAITAGKPKDEWPIVDKTYNFEFSLYQYDYIKVKRKKDSEWEEGYFVGVHSSSGAIYHLPNDASDLKKKIAVGAKTCFKIKKMQVDVLGNKTNVREPNRLSFKLNRNGVSKRTYNKRN